MHATYLYWKKWLQLLLGIIGIWLFIFVLSPFLMNKGISAKLIQFVKERDIDATPLFYTESELAAEAVQEIKEY